jgi:hypothetical protein
VCEGRIYERPKMIGWSLSQAGAPEMGISEEGAASCCTELPSQINTLVCQLFDCATYYSKYAIYVVTTVYVRTQNVIMGGADPSGCK